MKTKTTIDQLSALAQETRLEVFRQLVRMGDVGLPAGKIAEVTGANVSTLSRHLAVMENAGLLTSKRRARQIVYRINFDAVRTLFTFLLEDCCAGDVRLGTGNSDTSCVGNGHTNNGEKQ